MGPQVTLELAIDYAGRNEQRQFPKAGEFVFLRKQSSAVPGSNLARETFVCGRVYDDDFVSASIQKPAGNGTVDPLAGNSFHFVAKFFKILQIYGRVD